MEEKRPWTAGGSLLKLEGHSREVVHQFKYNSKLTLSRFLVPEMAWYVKRKMKTEISAVTMVPLHWTRKWKRGFNQAHILAEGIAKELNIPCVSLLRRKYSAAAQALKNKAQRQKNITRIFHVPQKEKMPQGTILLIDDVMTTGATARALAGLLVNAGATRVDIWLLARTPDQ